MASTTLHIFFLPFLTPGHMLPMVDMAKLFSQRGVRATLVTTPGNAARIRHSLGLDVHLLEVQFPSSVAGLPEGRDNLTDSRNPDVTEDFFRALNMLRQPFERLLKEHAPDCVISDAFYPWTTDVAVQLGIPRIIFNGPSAFALTAVHVLVRTCTIHQGNYEDREAFVVPELPDRIEMTRSQLPADIILSPLADMREITTANPKSYGIVVNSFRELEPGYAVDLMGLKTWYIGPLCLCNRDNADKAMRGEKASDGKDNDQCLRWLDAQAPGSVLYVCFGSLCRFTRPQLREIALGLEATGHAFLWVLRDVDGVGKEVLPERFEERTRGKGLVWLGWVPQLLILSHRAVGGFMTHCGWNSTLEGICAGVPLVAWPLFAEQFLNEKLVVQVLRVGVAVGATVCSIEEEERVMVEKQKVEEAVAQVMGGGGEAEAMRRRARELAGMAKKAVEEGGSSHSSMRNLIEDLIRLKLSKLHGSQ